MRPFGALGKFIGRLPLRRGVMRAFRRNRMENQDRYQRGWEKLKEVDGEAGERVIESLRDIAPDFARYLIEFSSCII